MTEYMNFFQPWKQEEQRRAENRKQKQSRQQLTSQASNKPPVPQVACSQPPPYQPEPSASEAPTTTKKTPNESVPTTTRPIRLSQTPIELNVSRRPHTQRARRNRDRSLQQGHGRSSRPTWPLWPVPPHRKKPFRRVEGFRHDSQQGTK